MYIIRDATNAFAKLDLTPPDEVAGLDKALRNLSMRAYLPPSGREGRADTYSLKTICALRLMHKAFKFGLGRGQVEDFGRFLQFDARPGLGVRVEKFDGGFRPLSPIEEAIQRVRERETFDMGLAMLSDGTFKPYAGWEQEPVSPEAQELLAAIGGRLSADARFALPASRLIGELLVELGA